MSRSAQCTVLLAAVVVSLHIDEYRVPAALASCLLTMSLISLRFCPFFFGGADMATVAPGPHAFVSQHLGPIDFACLLAQSFAPLLENPDSGPLAVGLGQLEQQGSGPLVPCEHRPRAVDLHDAHC